VTPELAAHQQRVGALVDEIVGPFVAEGRAAIVRTPDSAGFVHIDVKPRNPDACPFSLWCGEIGEVELAVGRHELSTHIWRSREWKRGNSAAIEHELRDWLEAFVAGRYEEDVRLTEEGETGKGRGVIGLPSGPHRFRYWNVPTLGRRGPWQKVRYAPY
jgi:hypothetical protein